MTTDPLSAARSALADAASLLGDATAAVMEAQSRTGLESESEPGHGLVGAKCICGWKAALGESIMRGYDRHLLDRRCDWCKEPIPTTRRIDAETCSKSCMLDRQRSRIAPVDHVPENPFLGIPSGIDIAHWWAEQSPEVRRIQGAGGTSLWSEGLEYCYLWVEALIDLDMTEHYLLDVRTKREDDETRDYLWVKIGHPGVECQWHNKPISFDAPHEDHLDRHRAGLKWFIALGGSHE